MAKNEFNRSAYIPDLKNIDKDAKSTAFSRNTHSFNRGKAFRLEKRKNYIINKYTNNENVFVFSLIDKKIKITHIPLKNQINNHISLFEEILKKVNQCKSDTEIDEIEVKINNTIKLLNNTLNHENFKKLIQNGYFTNNENINLRDTDEYKVTKPDYINRSTIKKNTSFSAIVKKNIN